VKGCSNPDCSVCQHLREEDRGHRVTFVALIFIAAGLIGVMYLCTT
jgi:hypothetical protein